jgi:IS30 family transposase
MKEGQTQSRIAKLMDRHKSTISMGVVRNTGNRGRRPTQACLLTEERFLGSHHAAQIDPKVWDTTVTCLHKKWSPEQIADQVGISHKTIYSHIYGYKAAGGSISQQLRRQISARKAMPAAGIAEANLLAEGGSANARAILTKLTAVTPQVKTLTFDKIKEFAEYTRIDTALRSTTYFADPLASWQCGSNENFNTSNPSVQTIAESTHFAAMI